MNIHTTSFLEADVTITVWFSSRNHILAVTITICMAPLPSLCSNILPEKPHKSVVNSYTWEKVPKREHIIKVSYIYSDIFIICQISLSSPPIECTIRFFSNSLKVCCQIVCALLVRMKHPGAAFSSSLQYSQFNSILQYSKFIAIFTPRTASLVRPAPLVWVECRRGKTQHFWIEEQQVGRGTLGGRRFVLIGCLQFLNFSRKCFTCNFTIMHLCGEKEVGKQMPGSSP